MKLFWDVQALLDVGSEQEVRSGGNCLDGQGNQRVNREEAGDVDGTEIDDDTEEAAPKAIIMMKAENEE